jgi:hypothetical protein
MPCLYPGGGGRDSLFTGLAYIPRGVHVRDVSKHGVTVKRDAGGTRSANTLSEINAGRHV